MKPSPVFLMVLFFTGCIFYGNGFSAATDMRCQCVKTLSKPIQMQQVLKLELINSGPYCPKVEVIVTLKRGSSVCLTPEAKWVKRLISKILKRAKKTQ
ncbi:interleukin-8-like [Aquarana catesbeiana]|uniref:interleukin-8-like n=1 Tax=Aquarana catesbeiana TaxID=8400 RepID=UPI003CC9CBE9